MYNNLARELIKKFRDRSSPLIIAIGGPGGSGKSTFASELLKHLDDSNLLKLDNYRKSRKERTGTGLLGSNPDANNIQLLLEHLRAIKNNNQFEHPVYNEVTGELEKTAVYNPAKFNIIDGELSLYDKVMEQVDFIIVVECGALTMLKDRLIRDRNNRSYSLIKSIRVFIQSTIFDFNKFCKPNISRADVVLCRKGDSYNLVTHP